MAQKREVACSPPLGSSLGFSMAPHSPRQGPVTGIFFPFLRWWSSTRLFTYSVLECSSMVALRLVVFVCEGEDFNYSENLLGLLDNEKVKKH